MNAKVCNGCPCNCYLCKDYDGGWTLIRHNPDDKMRIETFKMIVTSAKILHHSGYEKKCTTHKDVMLFAAQGNWSKVPNCELNEIAPMEECARYTEHFVGDLNR